MHKMYCFNEEEWLMLQKMFKRFEYHLPVFLQDFMNSFIVNHDNDQMIVNETELYQLIHFIQFITRFLSEEKKDDSNKTGNKKDQEENQELFDLEMKLKQLIKIILLKQINDYQNGEERDES